MNNHELPPKCLVYSTNNIRHDGKSEYIGEGYADYWDTFECRKCGNIWRSEKKQVIFNQINLKIS